MIVRLYRVLGEAFESDSEERLLAEAADLMVEMAERASARGDLDELDETFEDQPFIELLDALVVRVRSTR